MQEGHLTSLPFFFFLRLDLVSVCWLLFIRHCQPSPHVYQHQRLFSLGWGLKSLSTTGLSPSPSEKQIKLYTELMGSDAAKAEPDQGRDRSHLSPASMPKGALRDWKLVPPICATHRNQLNQMVDPRKLHTTMCAAS